MPILLAGPIQPILEVHDLKLTVAPKPESRDLKLMKYLNWRQRGPNRILIDEPLLKSHWSRFLEFAFSRASSWALLIDISPLS